jgi:tRNA pseudouridine55 synthase
MHGLINFLKPPGMTSHDAVQMARRATGIKRIGHSGTLDPAAAGVLPLCVGSATRLCEYMLRNGKEYIAESTFGYETDTLDAVGETIKTQPDFAPRKEDIQNALQHFTGDQQQIPPHFSALKKDGKKLYDLARAGETPELQPRLVQIHQLELLHYFPATSDSPMKTMLRVKCGSGTYIRSLVRDIAHYLGGCATMTFLVRTQSGACNIANAHTAEEIIADPAACLLPLTKILSWCFDEVVCDDEKVLRLSQGQWVEADWQNHRVAATSQDGNLAVIARRLEDQKSKYKPEKVMNIGD